MMDCNHTWNAHPQMGAMLQASCVAAQQRERGMDGALFNLTYKTNTGLVTLWVDDYSPMPGRVRAKLMEVGRL